MKYLAGRGSNAGGWTKMLIGLAKAACAGLVGLPASDTAEAMRALLITA